MSNKNKVEGVCIYEEIEKLVLEMKQQNLTPTTDRFVYSKKELYEDYSTEPRYQISVMFKKFF